MHSLVTVGSILPSLLTLRPRLFTRFCFSMTSAVRSVEENESRVKRVGTHNGTFHCDEALGCYMIRLTAKYAGAEIVRTREPKVLDTLDAVLDVGGVYDPSRDRFDHHQRGFDQVFGHGFATKLSSAGLVYKAIDAVDNGINQYDTDQPPKYVNSTHLSSRAGRLNLDWIDEDQSQEKENERFYCAMNLAGGEFLENVRSHAKSWLPARSIVEESVRARQEIDSSGEIVVLKRFCPWKLHLFELEQELKIEPSIKYVLYEDERGQQWRVQAVAVSPDKFESRKPLPESWRGLRDEDLSRQCDIPNCVFVHISGFIGGNKSFEGALAMAKAALKL
ncbi:uncharacterized protein LOC131070499 isoform X2 [Cryptomeria japonica]|uniref:uncharacterized protein LOC131070499 isoform X2 n=1 Tax=Cryptomeria japonica TaxID=3369 RepID=UPI0027DAB3ED|nr:uncharacterized protein LOC131070499 isoform X2 [Cryptomeria japonica]